MDPNRTPVPPTVDRFSETLLWPLHLRGPSNLTHRLGDLATFLTAQGPWQSVTDRYRRGRAAEQAYAELVYFHPFVQRFLYGSDAGDPSPPVRIFERRDIQGLRVDLGEVDGPIDFQVARVQIYAFDLDIAILVCEIEATGPLSIQRTEAILDRVRRAYPPYWDRDKKTKEALGGHCPRSCRWLPERNALPAARYGDTDGFLKCAEAHRRPSVAGHWAQLLAPLGMEGSPGLERWTLRQVEDDRIPFMAHLAVSDPRQLTPGDFVRLAFADEPGDSRTLPYATEFLKDFKQHYCYDRYWGGPSDPEWMTTRYLCAGYSFVMVGNAADKEFFLNGEGGALAHFRHHYLQMGLIAHFHRAALLLISDHLSDAIAGGLEAAEFRGKTGDILKRVLNFTHRYWFHEVSNQIQGRQLFTWWSGHLDTQRLYEQVDREARGVNAYLDAREQERQTRFTNRLTVVATFGLILALFVTLAALVDAAPVKDWLTCHWVRGYALALALPLGAVAALVVASKPLSRLLDWLSSWGKRQ